MFHHKCFLIFLYKAQGNEEGLGLNVLMQLVYDYDVNKYTYYKNKAEIIRQANKEIVENPNIMA
jgi:hypothetical protein